MLRWTALLIVVASLATTGCRYCASPYDYCGPLFTGRDCTPCDPDARAGSIFADQLMPVPMYGQECCQADGPGLRPVPQQLAGGAAQAAQPATPGVDQPVQVIHTAGPPRQAPAVLWPQAPWQNRMVSYPAPWMPRR